MQACGAAHAPSTRLRVQVDWGGLIKSIKWIAKEEPRYCNFVIRSHFHDAGATFMQVGRFTLRYL